MERVDSRVALLAVLVLGLGCELQPRGASGNASKNASGDAAVGHATAGSAKGPAGGSSRKGGSERAPSDRGRLNGRADGRGAGASSEDERADRLSEISAQLSRGFAFGESESTRAIGSSDAAPTTREILGAQKATDQIFAALQESASVGPTLVVWLFDRSKSAERLTAEVVGQLRAAYARGDGPSEKRRLETAIVAFGGDVRFVLDPPSGDAAAVGGALGSWEIDDSGREWTFAAVKEALDKYRDQRVRQRREVFFVIVTDEAGDDPGLLEPIVTDIAKWELPVYVIGVPAPFGRRAALLDAVEIAGETKPEGHWLPIQQGPESWEPERLALELSTGIPAAEMYDSGFGPIGLERLCRASGGSYLALRPGGGRSFGSPGTNWPLGAAAGFDQRQLRKYAPDNISRQEYEKQLAASPTRKALVEAARQPKLEIPATLRTDFAKAAQAEIVRQATDAQKLPALALKKVDTLYTLLREGEAARAQVDSPRWQAGYDLAMGQVLAAKARLDGYVELLAALKRGKSFQNEASTMWMLVPGQETDTSSSVRKLGERSRMYLERVVKDHAGTPWAQIARQELQIPVGWKWTER